MRRRLSVAVMGLCLAGLLAGAAAAQPARPAPGPGRLDAAGLRAALTALGYPAREVQNEAGVEYEIVLRLRTGSAVTTRVTLSKDGSLVWLVAWLKKVPAGRTVSGNAVLDMLVENDTIGPAHFSYNEKVRWFFLNSPIVNRDLTPERLRGEIDHVAGIAARTEPLWDFERWR
ncbi:MAG TPA: hypothetical protein VFE48_17450 [Methylomirabilota bacterium]|nr:hypothetical protein [Methylomirabilota bacterium]